MISTSDFRKGAKIEHKGAPHEIVDFQHHKMGRGGAIVRTKLKNLKTGSIFDDSFKGGEKFKKPAQFDLSVGPSSMGSHGRSQYN